MKDFLSLLDYSHDELTAQLDRADTLRALWQTNQMPASMQQQRIGLWFFGDGFRNRLAFEIGAEAMGARVSYIPGALGVNEPLEDIGRYLENWYSILIVRAARHDDLLYLAAHTAVPVINARTNLGHPCEIMGDLQFIRQQRGSIEGLNVIFVGAVTNLCLSWFEAAARFPIRVTQVAPESYLADAAFINRRNDDALGEISTDDDLEDAIDDADLIYTDCWPSASDAAPKDAIRVLFLPYQITASHLSRLKPGALFLPCPPVTRGEEVSEDAMRSPLCMNYAAKAHLLHAQNAIMERLVLNRAAQTE